jgi:hypothetical protein
MKATATQAFASEQNPAESQQSDSLPEGNLPPSEQRRQQPVPQLQHDFAANRYENRDHQWDQKKPFPFHVVFLTSS